MVPRVRIDGAPYDRRCKPAAGPKADAVQDIAAAGVDRRLAHWRQKQRAAAQHCIRATVFSIMMPSPENGCEWPASARERSDVEQLRRRLQLIALEEAQGRQVLAQAQASLGSEAQLSSKDDQSDTGSSPDVHADLARSTGCFVLRRRPRLIRQGRQRRAPPSREEL